MEIIAEIFIQLFGWVFELLGELLLQAFGELIAELIGRSITEPFRRPKPVHPVLATLGYAIFGALAGGISLWLLPSLFIAADWLRALNLVVTPRAENSATNSRHSEQPLAVPMRPWIHTA